MTSKLRGGMFLHLKNTVPSRVKVFAFLGIALGFSLDPRAVLRPLALFDRFSLSGFVFNHKPLAFSVVNVS